MDEEMRFHIEMQVRKNQAAGMSLEEARYAALRSFGGLERAKKVYRDLRGIGWMEAFWQDIRYGLRLLCRNPGLAVLVVLTLALDMGLCSLRHLSS